MNHFWRVFLLIKTCFYVKIAEIWIFRHSLLTVFWKLQSIRWPHNVIWGAWSKWPSYIYGAHWHYVFSMFWINSHCVKYARMLVFSDPYFRVESQNVCFCPYARKYGSEKTRTPACFRKCWSFQGNFLQIRRHI